MLYQYAFNLTNGQPVELPAPVDSSQLFPGANGMLYGQDTQGQLYFFGLQASQRSGGMGALGGTITEALQRLSAQVGQIMQQQLGTGSAGAAQPEPEVDDVLQIPGGTAPRITSTSELSARIKAAGGALVVSPYSSEMIIAKNNDLQYSVTKQADGNYKITDKGYTSYYLIAGVAAAVLLIVFRNN